MNGPRVLHLRTAATRARSLGIVVTVTALALFTAVGPARAARAPQGVAGAGAASGSAWSGTKTLTRTFADPSGTLTVDERTVTVTVDKTQDLRGRERVRVSWSGAHPSGGRAVNPYGEAGLAQEYPVVVLQCRGRDDPSLPAAQQLDPRTCWTSTRMQRTAFASDTDAVWRHDAVASPADRAQSSGLDPYPASCPSPGPLSSHVTPFVAASGRVYSACDAASMPPEAAVGATYPASEQAAFTDQSGHGSTLFEVRSDIENESLGCSAKVACSIVVVPIMGISCMDQDLSCTKTGRFLAGTSNFAGEGVDDAVSPAYWWSASNWRGRFSVPVTMGLPPDVCTLLDPRAPTGFYGSELMSQASLQWAPAYCLSAKRFKFQHNRMPDEASFVLMTKGGAAAAFVSSARDAGTTPVAYAPTAVTGFAVGYIVDKPDNAGEQVPLRLNARLLAKLLTESYPASDLGRQHPGLEGNPVSINLDPEFRALNPGLDTIAREAAATVLSLSDSSDVVRTLTAYIAADPAAKAFVDGAPDPWGMKVNPFYKKLALPVDQWPLLDTFVPASQLECRRQNAVPYLPLVAAPVKNMRTIAEAVLDAWPNVQTKCDRPTTSDPWKLGRVDRQGVGSRFLLGIVSLGDAARYGLHPAQLETSVAAGTPARFTDAAGRTFVGPDDAGLAAAVALGTQKERLGTFEWTQAQVRAAKTAYPGTMVVYTAARTSGLGTADATKVAQFIEVATSEGQRPGSGNGELPAGYLPLTGSGTTRRLLTAAVAAAVAIRAQAPVPAITTSTPTAPSTTSTRTGTDGPSGGGTGPGGPGGGATLPSGPPGGGLPGSAGLPTGTPTGGGPVAGPAFPVATAAADPGRTGLVSSPLAGAFLPLLLLLVPASAVVASVAMLLRRPRRRGAAA